MANDTPPGWYPAPDASDLLRYWDGEMWTEQARPAPTGRAGPAMGHSSTPSIYVQGSSAVLNRLKPGEMIEAGFHEGAIFNSDMFVATDTRLMIFDTPGIRRRYRMREYGYEQVESIDTSTWSGVTLKVGGDTHQCTSEDKAAVSDFIQYVRARKARTGSIDVANLPKPKPHDSGSDAAGAIDPNADANALATRIREMAKLHAEGILNDEEFAAAKAKLLDL